MRPADKGGCGYYRMIWPGEAARKVGVDVEIIFGTSFQTSMCNNAFGGRAVMELRKVPKGDVFVFQRPLKRQLYEVMRILREQHGKTIVVEVDDDFHALPIRHPMRPNVNPALNPDVNWDWLAKACEMADLVTCTTPALAARYGAHGRVAIIPNYLPKHFLKARHQPHEGSPILGWAGSTHSHVDDLKTTKGSIALAIHDSLARMAVVGTGDGVARQLGLSQEPDAYGWASIEAYPSSIARFDVAIAPLKDSAFNDAKSFLKPLESGAVGVPCVMSPSPAYRELAEAGVGIVAETPQDWYDRVSLLLKDRAMREDLGELSRSIVTERFMLDGHAGLWAEAWALAKSNRERELVSV